MNHKESHVNVLIPMIVPHQLSKNVNMKHSPQFLFRVSEIIFDIHTHLLRDSHNHHDDDHFQ